MKNYIYTIIIVKIIELKLFINTANVNIYVYSHHPEII